MKLWIVGEHWWCVIIRAETETRAREVLAAKDGAYTPLPFRELDPDGPEEILEEVSD